MKKRLLALLLMTLWLPAWSSTAQTTVGFLVGAGGVGDESYNDMTLAGLAEANRTFGVRVIHELSDETEEGIRSALDRLVAGKANIIVSNRIAHPRVIYDFARRHGDKYFILNDMPWKGHANVSSLGYANNEGAFLAGALAGWLTRTGKVAFIGGNQLPVIESFRVGYGEGVYYANPEAHLIEVFIAKGKDEKGFDNPSQGYQSAMKLYDQGVDIIFAAAGLSGNGAIYAAKAANRFIIGVDTNQDHMAKGHVLTSMMKRLDKATFQEVAAILRNNFQPGPKFYGLKQGGVELSPMSYTKPLIPRAVLNYLEETKAKIIAGQIQVTPVNYLEAGP